MSLPFDVVLFDKIHLIKLWHKSTRTLKELSLSYHRAFASLLWLMPLYANCFESKLLMMKQFN
jgi:hypothetical protein